MILTVESNKRFKEIPTSSNLLIGVKDRDNRQETIAVTAKG